MRTLWPRWVVWGFAVVLAVTAGGQTKSEDKPAPRTERKAFSEANGIKEPEKKVAALVAFLKEFPNGDMTGYAAREAVLVATKTWPNDKRRMKKLVKTLSGLLDEPGKAKVYNQVAWEYHKANRHPKDAEKYARMAVDAWTWDSYLAAERRSAKPDDKPSDEATLRAEFAADRASALDTLGQVCARRGKSEEAKRLLKEALQGDPTLGGAAETLADLAVKANRTGEALDYISQARLAGATPERRAKLDGIWRRAHDDSLAGLEDYLDQRYKTLYPNPVHPTEYEPPAKRSGRVVLAEVHTGAGCPPCAAADLAFDVEIERLSRKDLAVIMYHQHIPRPDPMSNDDDRIRWKWQKGNGVPTYVIDGKMDGGGGRRGRTAELVGKIEGLIAPRLEAPAGAELSVGGSHEGRLVRMKADVAGIASESKDLQLQFTLVEKLIRYSGENGIRFHPMVVRSFVRLPLDGAKAKSFEQVFDVDELQKKLKEHIANFEKHDEWHNKDGKFRFAEKRDDVNAENLAVVAFVQDDKTKEVLQAAYFDLSPEMVSHK